MALRLKSMGTRRYQNGFSVTIHEDLFDQPIKWKTPRTIFVNSMSDLFHEEVPSSTIVRLFEIMRNCEHHTFQILTKRAERLLEISDLIQWPKNVWMGVTVESEDYISRIDILKKTPAAVKFISFEPLLSAIDARHSLRGIDWIIVGGESGPGARPMDAEWARGLRSMADRDGSSYFFKQWGGVNKKKTGRVLDGKVYDAMPVHA
jgi:protein gp37